MGSERPLWYDSLVSPLKPANDRAVARRDRTPSSWTGLAGSRERWPCARHLAGGVCPYSAGSRPMPSPARHRPFLAPFRFMPVTSRPSTAASASGQGCRVSGRDPRPSPVRGTWSKGVRHACGYRTDVLDGDRPYTDGCRREVTAIVGTDQARPCGSTQPDGRILQVRVVSPRCRRDALRGICRRRQWCRLPAPAMLCVARRGSAPVAA